MNTQTNINFAETKQVLQVLEQYVKNKIAAKSMPAEVSQPEMNLASQPVMPSDHLTEEANLTVENVATEAPSLDNEVTNLIAGVSEEMNMADAAQTPAPAEMIAPAETVAPVAPAVEAVPEVIDASAAGLTTEMPQPEQMNMAEAVQTPAPTEMVAPAETVVPAVDVAPAALDTSATNLTMATPQPEEITTPQPGEMVIPEIPSVPQEQSAVVGEQAPSSYVATSNEPATVIPDVTPAVPQEPVVMPEGTTNAMANDEQLVVGPEAFTQSR